MGGMITGSMNDLFLSLEPARRPENRADSRAESQSDSRAEMEPILQSLADCLDANRALRGALTEQQAQARRLHAVLEIVHDALTPFGSAQAARHLHPEHQKVLGEIAQYAARALLCGGGETDARRAA